MADLVTIWNLALSAAGSRAQLSSPTEVGREADLCRLWYPLVRDVALKAASWPCASAYSRLSVVAERDFSDDWTAGSLAPGFRFAYAAPALMLAPRYLMTFGRFTVGQYNEQTLIHANDEEAVLHYTARVENTELWDSGLTHVVVSALAAKMVIPLSGKESRRRELRDEAVEAILVARGELANESDEHFETPPSWIQERGFSMPAGAQRFVWPVGDVSSIQV